MKREERSHQQSCTVHSSKLTQFSYMRQNTHLSWPKCHVGSPPVIVTVKRNNLAKKVAPQLLEDLSWVGEQDWWEECASWFPCSTDPCLQLLLPQPAGVQIRSSSAFPDIAQFLFTASGLDFSKEGARCLFLQEARCVNSSINIPSKLCSSAAKRASGNKPREQEPRKENIFKEHA